MGNGIPDDTAPERLSAAAYGRRTQLSLEHEARYRFIAQLTAGKRILDVGCGEGLMLELAARNGAAELFGIDGSEEALDAVRQQLAGYPNVHLQKGPAETLPYADRSFDLVTALEVIEHLDQPDAAVAECRRVVKPDGLVIVSVPNDGLLPAANPYHRNRFTHSRLLGLMRQHFPHVRLFRLVTYAGATVLPFGHEETTLRLPELEHRGWAAAASMRKLPAIASATALGPLSGFEAESTGRFEGVISHLAREIEGLKSDLRDLRQSALYRWLHRLAVEAGRRDLRIPGWVLPEGFRSPPADKRDGGGPGDT